MNQRAKVALLKQISKYEYNEVENKPKSKLESMNELSILKCCSHYNISRAEMEHFAELTSDFYI